MYRIKPNLSAGSGYDFRNFDQVSQDGLKEIYTVFWITVEFIKQGEQLQVEHGPKKFREFPGVYLYVHTYCILTVSSISSIEVTVQQDLGGGVVKISPKDAQGFCFKISSPNKVFQR
jgi:hypothetical protein